MSSRLLGIPVLCLFLAVSAEVGEAEEPSGLPALPPARAGSLGTLTLDEAKDAGLAAQGAVGGTWTLVSAKAPLPTASPQAEEAPAQAKSDQDVRPVSSPRQILEPSAPPKEEAPKRAHAGAAQERAIATTGEEGSRSLDAGFFKRINGDRDVLALAGGTPSEENPAIPRALRLDEIVAAALQNNFEIKAAQARKRGAYWDKMGTYSQYLPTVDVNLATGAEHSQPASYNDEVGNRVLDNTHHRFDRQVTIKQPLLDLGIVADILSTRNKETIVGEDQRDAQETVAYDTITAFFKLIQAKTSVELADQYKRYLDDLAQRMRDRVEGGGGTEADLDRIRSRAALAESARIEALGDYDTQLAELQRLTKVTPSGLVLPSVLAPSSPATAESALEQAARSNPAYLSSLHKIDLAVADRNKSITGGLPKFAFQYSNELADNAGGSAKGNPVDGVYPKQKTESAMLVAQWSLNGGTPVTGALSGAAKVRETRLRSQDVWARLEQGLRSGYAALRTAEDRGRLLRQTVATNERVVAGFEDQYREGTRSLFDVLDAYEQLYSTRLNLARVLVAHAQSAYQIQRMMGSVVGVLAPAKET